MCRGLECREKVKKKGAGGSDLYDRAEALDGKKKWWGRQKTARGSCCDWQRNEALGVARGYDKMSSNNH